MASALRAADADRVGADRSGDRARLYTDVTNLKLVHPLIVTVRRVDPERWRVQERMPFGGLPFRIWYSARVRVEANGDVVGESRLFLACGYRTS